MAKAMDQVVTGQKKWSDYVEPFKFVPKKWHRVRPYGLVTTDFRHNVPTLSKKSYPEYCHGWDEVAEDFYPDREVRCEACKRGVSGSFRYFMNFIDIEVEENQPKNPPPNWTPLRFAELSKTLFEKLQKLTGLNKGYPVTHPDFGAIVSIQYDNDAEGESMYSASMDEKNVPLTTEQKSYSIVQRYVDSTRKVITGDGKEPPSFIYIRCVNTRAEMIKGLDRHKVGVAAEKFASLEDMNEDKMVAKAAAEMPVMQAPVFSAPQEEEDDEVPFAPPASDKKESAHAECPTAFGEFANSNLCFTKCKARGACRELSNANKTAAKNGKSKKEDDDNC